MSSIALTYFASRINAPARGGQVWTGEWADLEGYLRSRTVDAPEKDTSGYLVAAACRDGVRNDAAAEPTCVVALDWDKDGAEPDWTQLADYDYVAHTTGSHLKVCAQNPSGAPRWAVWIHTQPATQADIKGAQCPWPGGVLRSISQPRFVPTTGDRTEWRSHTSEYEPVNLALDWARPVPTVLATPFVPPATKTRPSAAWVNAFVARVVGTPERTNDCFGACGAALAASGWTNDEIGAALDAWFTTYPLGRHRDSALRAADKRRADDRVPCFPRLAELGVPWVVDDPDYLDISALMLSEPTPDDEAELRAAIGGEWVQGAQVTAKVTPPNWLVAKLGLAPGRYAGLSGYASAGKTWFAQGLVMAVAQGTPFCGLGVRQGRALHIDHEQGSDMTRERYQLLGFDGGTEDLAYVSFPAWRLSGKDGKQLLFRLARGRALIAIDSLRASIGGDENSSEIRQWLDGVSEVSEATQCTMLVLHHARKGSTSSDSAGDDMYKARGSSGIVDAAGTFWHLNLQDRDPHEDTRPPSMLVQTKPGRHPPGGVIGETPFIVRPNSDGSVTLSLDTSRPEPSTQLEQYTARILKCLAGNPRRIKSANKLVDAVGGDRNAILKALQALKEDGCVIFHNGALMLQEQL